MTGRGLAGRRQARLMLFAAIALDAFVVFLFVAQPATMGGPNTSGPMFIPVEPPSRLVWLVPAFGILLNVVGLAWMVRILRADPEGGPSAWRAILDG